MRRAVRALCNCAADHFFRNRITMAEILHLLGKGPAKGNFALCFSIAITSLVSISLAAFSSLKIIPHQPTIQHVFSLSCSCLSVPSVSQTLSVSVHLLFVSKSSPTNLTKCAGDSISLTLYSTDVDEEDCYLLHRLLQEDSVKLFGLVRAKD